MVYYQKCAKMDDTNTIYNYVDQVFIHSQMLA